MVRRRCATLLLFTLILIPTSGSFPAAAQVGLEARLLDINAWIGPQDILRAVIEVGNHGEDAVSDIRVSIAIHEGITTRSQLARSFLGRFGPTVSSDTHPVEGTIEPGTTRRIVIEKPISEIAFFRTAPERAYPVSIVARAGRASAPTARTHVVFFRSTASIPLEVALVVPIGMNAIYDSSGTAVVPTTFNPTLGGGSGAVLANTISALESVDVPMTIAPSGLLLEQLRDLSDGYETTDGRQVGRGEGGAQLAASALARIRSIAERPSTRVVSGTYSGAILPWLVRSGLAERALAQVGETKLRIQEGMGVAPMEGWLLPHSGALDEPALTALLRAAVTHPIVSGDSVRLPTVPLTRSAPVRLRTRTATAEALVSDSVLESRLSVVSEAGAVETRQRFLAETATIMLERPAQTRAVMAVGGLDWEDGHIALRGVLDALANSPWMRGVTPDDVASNHSPGGTFELASTDTVLDGLPSPPDSAYADHLRRARSSIASYAEIGPPPERVARLERNLLIAESSRWWNSRRASAQGISFAASVRREVEREFQKIKAPEAQTITLTSRSGVIPLIFTTGTDYAVRVSIRLESDKLSFPEGRVIEGEISPPAQTLDVLATAQSSGSFPLRVTVETPGEGRLLDSTLLNIRSTAYNRLGVAITGGAGIFLVTWWVAGAVRRRLR